MERASARAGRRADEITLMAVSKTHSAKRIHELFEAGVRHFGENRVQEWELKRSSLMNLAATWHMIGHVQSNKVARAVRLFDSVDTVDSAALAERIEKARTELAMEALEGGGKRDTEEESGRRLRVLIEVKLDPRPAKSGVMAEELPRLVDAILLLPHLELRGLFGVAPYFDNPEEARPHFCRLRELRDAVRAQMGREVLPVLSMGMSRDFEVAIEEGATEIRVGSALFGERREA